MNLQLEQAGESNVWAKKIKRRYRIGGKQTPSGEPGGSEKSYKCQILEKIKKYAKDQERCGELITLFECRSTSYFFF